MSWTISSDEVTVTLPFGPLKTRISNPAKVDQFVQEGELPIVIVDGAENFTVTFEGVIYDDTKTASEIFQDIIFPLLQKRGTLISLATPEGILDGSYVLASFEPSRVGVRPRWTYTMHLVMGGAYVIL